MSSIRPDRAAARQKLLFRVCLLILLVAAVIGIGVSLTSGDQRASGEREASKSLPKAPYFKPAICTEFLDPKADLATALARAQPGAVICLRGGSYPGGRIPADATDKSGFVTLQPAPGEKPAFTGELAFDGASYLRIQGLRFESGLKFQPAASHLELIGNVLTGVGGIFLFGDRREGGSTRSILIQGNYIHDIDYNGWQGVYGGYGIRSIGSQDDVTVRGNEIKSVAADYIQTDVANDWTVDANTFLGPSLVAGHPQEHQDLWQVYAGGTGITFTNNVARRTGTSESLLFQLTYADDSFSHVTVTNNLLDHETHGYSCQIYQSTGLIFRANTIVGSRYGCLFRDDRRYGAGSGYAVDHNLFANTSDGADLGAEGRVPGWGNFDHNVSSDGSATGPGSVANWTPHWDNTDDYLPLNLAVPAGYRPGG